MSRVYEALCRSQEERGLPTGLLEPSAYATEVRSEEKPQLVLGTTIATFEAPKDPLSRLVALDGENELGAEKFRVLRTRLRHLQERQPVKKVVITSAVPGEGKTLVAINLAISLAKHTNQKVLLIDGDLHKPLVAERLGLSGAVGIGEWFSKSSSTSLPLYQMSGVQLWVLAGGAHCPQPSAVLQSTKFLEMLGRLSKSFDWVIIDTPPLLPLADVNCWVREADGLLLVVRQGRTPKQVLEKGLENLDNPRILGIVLNDAQVQENSYYHHYYPQPTHPPGK